MCYISTHYFGKFITQMQEQIKKIDIVDVPDGNQVFTKEFNDNINVCYGKDHTSGLVDVYHEQSKYHETD